jgi:two-component system, LytTR family, sensor kinase
MYVTEPKSAKPTAKPTSAATENARLRLTGGGMTTLMLATELMLVRERFLARCSRGAGPSGKFDAVRADQPGRHVTERAREHIDIALSSREVTAIVLSWAFLGVLSASVRLLDPRVPTRPEVAAALARVSFAEYTLWAALSIPIVWLAARYSIEGGQRLERVLVFVALGIAVAICVDWAVANLRMELLPESRRRFRPGRRFIPPRPITSLGFIDDLMVYFAVLGGGVARDYFLRYRAREQETSRLQAEAAHLHAQLAEARLTVLRTQLDPHFLFNTLNAVSALVERDPRGVRRMIARLSDLLRHTLEEQPAQEVTLNRELELLRRYLDIMEIRFQGRLQVAFHIEPEVHDALVPHLLLQPIVENALKHGISDLEEIGRIEIEARSEGDDLVLVVRDNGPGPVDDPSSGVGVRNTVERLRELYGDRGRFVLRRGERGGAMAEVRMPRRLDSPTIGRTT